MPSYTFPTEAGQPLRIVICGGGASSVLLLAALNERTTQPVAVTIMEPHARLGVGVAYSTPCAAHLLNTRACNMSVNTDATDFVQWLRSARHRRGFNWGAHDFAPRRFYGEYLQAKLDAIRATERQGSRDPAESVA